MLGDVALYSGCQVVGCKAYQGGAFSISGKLKMYDSDLLECTDGATGMNGGTSIADVDGGLAELALYRCTVADTQVDLSGTVNRPARPETAPIADAASRRVRALRRGNVASSECVPLWLACAGPTLSPVQSVERRLAHHRGVAHQGALGAFGGPGLHLDRQFYDRAGHCHLRLLHACCARSR